MQSEKTALNSSMPGQYLKTFFSVAISLLILQLHSFAQDKVRYGGYVADPDGYFPVTGASVALIHGSDTLYTTTDKYGGFAIENAPAGNATISITHILYKPVEKKTLIKNGHPDLFYMEKGENTLQSSKVTASVPVITVKGDTLVYNRYRSRC